MIQKGRENLFALLRGYHETPGLLEASNAETGRFTADLEGMKEKIVSMVLGLIRGNEEFKDWSPDLLVLATKAKIEITHTAREKQERELIGDKIQQLLAIIALTKKELIET